jgi:hypothetical protein
VLWVNTTRGTLLFSIIILELLDFWSKKPGGTPENKIIKYVE